MVKTKKSVEEWNAEAKAKAEEINEQRQEAFRDYLEAKEKASDKKKAYQSLVAKLEETIDYYHRYGPGKADPPPKQGTLNDVNSDPDEDENEEETEVQTKKRKPKTPEVTVSVQPGTGIEPAVGLEKSNADIDKLRSVKIESWVEEFGLPIEVVKRLELGTVNAKGQSRGFSEPIVTYGDMMDFRKNFAEYIFTDFTGIGDESANMLLNAELEFLKKYTKPAEVKPDEGKDTAGNTGQGNENNNGEPGGVQPAKRGRGRPKKPKPTEPQVP